MLLEYYRILLEPHMDENLLHAGLTVEQQDFFRCFGLTINEDMTVAQAGDVMRSLLADPCNLARWQAFQSREKLLPPPLPSTVPPIGSAVGDAAPPLSRRTPVARNDNDGRFRAVPWLSGALFVAVAIVVLGPFYTLHKAFVGFYEEDLDALAWSIDFPRVKRSLREQMKDWVGRHGGDVSQGLSEEFGSSFGWMVADTILDDALTPEGAIRAVQSLRDGPVQIGSTYLPWRLMRMFWIDSPSHVTFRIGSVEDHDLYFDVGLRRSGLIWTIDKIQLSALK